MPRRSAALVGVLALSLSITVPGFQAAAQGAARFEPGDAGHALSRLRAAAHGSIHAHRGSDGTVDHVSSSNGRAILPAPSGADTPREAVQAQLDRYGEAFGIDGTSSKAVVDKTVASSTGGSVVRAQQVVDGLPVFGGQVVATLDRNDGVTSFTAATTPTLEVPAAKVTQTRARGVALGFVARGHHVRASALHVDELGAKLYDPALVRATDTVGARRVWQFEVGNGLDIRETVLVDAVRGGIALHFDDIPELDRKICDNAGGGTVSSDAQVPVCSTAARTEGQPATSVADVNAAYDNLGAVAQAYTDLDAKDLNYLIGYTPTPGGARKLTATVRWCFSDDACPFPNAFWDGRQMVFGAGYAGADDVVGHELTHGYVERTSGLFYFDQSGSINESVADTIGEIVDHRHDPSGPEDNSAWTVGEDLGDPAAVRSLADPTLHGQPDSTSSILYGTEDIRADVPNDNGDVHLNDGVGNKTAYLISQGGTFGGQTIAGIDAGDPSLAKTGRLYLETIPSLTSGADYAQLGNVLVSTCQRLAAAGTGGFQSSDCDSVSQAVVATGLEAAPTGAPGQAPITCPVDRPEKDLARDDDGVSTMGFTSSSPLWGRTDGTYVPHWAVSGKSSLFAFDPDPHFAGDDPSGTMTSSSFVVPATTGGTFMNFHHAYVLDFDDTSYYDGGQVLVQKLVNGTWTTVNGLPWVNGPGKHINGSTPAGFTGFGGDSHGYGSSQVNVTSLAGQTVRFVFRIEGDNAYSAYGWWIDDVRLYSCAMPAPSAPSSVTVKGSDGAAAVSWKPPTNPGSGVTGYVVTRSDGGQSWTLPASARSFNITAFTGTIPVTISVAALGADGTPSPRAAQIVYPTISTLSSSVSRVKKRKAFVLTAKVVRRGTSSGVSGMPVLLQRRVVGTSRWIDMSRSTTGSHGTKAWSMKQSRATSYRVLASGFGPWFASISGSRTVSVR